MDVAATLRHLRCMQDSGLRFMSRVRTRADVEALMEPFKRTLRIGPLPPIVHVAGTKGKGSTCAMVESCLRSSGLRTGLFTSPHLVCPTERIRINGVPVSREAYLSEFSGCLEELQGANGGALPASLSGFNFLLLLAYRLFSRAALDVLVLEVSVGGLLCATNALPASKVLVSGVTLLDYDHMALLGSTLEEIAAQKAGIFRPGVPAVAVRPHSPSVAGVLEAVARGQGTPLQWSSEEAFASACPGGRQPRLSLQGRFQLGNAALAASLVDIALQRLRDCIAGSGLGSEGAAAAAAAAAASAAAPPADYRFAAPLPQGTLDGLATASWPGRAQRVALPLSAAGPQITLFLDGAHTPMSMAEVCLWFRGCLREQQQAGPAACALIFYCGRDKVPGALMASLAASAPWAQVHIVDIDPPPGAAGGGGGGGALSPWVGSLSEAWVRACAGGGEGEAHLPEGSALSWAQWLEREGGALPAAAGQQEGPVAAAQPHLHHCFTDALASVKASAAASGVPHNVLVTGSLYLVGEALRVLA